MKGNLFTTATLFLLTLILFGCNKNENDKQSEEAGKIPLIDISANKDMQVIVDKEARQYLGHVTTVLLKDEKTIIAVYPKGHGKGQIVMKQSTDGGKTWSKRLSVPENWSTSKEVPTIFPITSPSGKESLIMFSGLYPVRISRSEDEGKTWTPLEPIGNFGGIVAMASMVQLKDGSYMAFFHDDGRFFTENGRTDKFIVYKIISKDGGVTWSKPEIVVEDKNVDLCEPGIVRSPDGKQLAMLLRENSRKKNSMIIFSDDEGLSWTKPQELPDELTGDRHTCKYSKDGRLVITFRDMAKDITLKGDWVAWVGTYNDLVNKTKGEYRIRLMDNKNSWDCAYPGLELLPDSTFVTTTYGHWEEKEEPYIVSVRFKLKDIEKQIKK